MSQVPIKINDLPEEKREEFKRLTSAPVISRPTLMMWMVLVVSILMSDVLGVLGQLPLWLCAVINSVVGYLAFSVVHDSIHRTCSTDKELNDWMGQSAAFLFAPYVSIKLFRWGHILHHRFTSGDRDPDRVFNGAWYTLPFRWMLIDVFYLIHSVKHGDKVSRPHFVTSLKMAMGFFVVVTALIAAGYGEYVLWLWFIPSRLVFLWLGFTFFWLPHVPHDTTQEENFTRATAIREGHEWLLGPVMQYQNYHLIHHMFPMTPFYNNHKVFKLIEPELRAKCDLAVQHGFAIHPTIYPAPENA